MRRQLLTELLHILCDRIGFGKHRHLAIHFRRSLPANLNILLRRVLVERGGLDFNTLAVLALGGLAAGGIVGFLVGTFAGRQLPVQVRRYDPARGTLSLRFRNPDYAAQVLDAMRTQARQSRR